MTGEAERPGPTYRKSALLALGAWLIACLVGGMRLVAPDSSLFYWAALVAFMGVTPLMYSAGLFLALLGFGRGYGAGRFLLTFMLNLTLAGMTFLLGAVAVAAKV